MSISVEGQKCPVCNAYLFDNDDIVYCPICGAPHHRDCYAAIGHCAYEDRHGTDRQDEWKNQTDEAKEDNTTQEQQQPNNQNRLHSPCRSCGADVPVGSPNCPSCGAPIHQAYSPFGSPIVFDPLGGVGENEDIDGVKAYEVKDFVAVNTPRYVPKIKALHKKKKISWNWGAFLFPHAWFFYRKMYLPGLFYFVFMLASQAMALPLSNYLFGGKSGVPEFNNYGEIVSYLTSHLTDPAVLGVFSLALTGLLVGLIIRLIAGMFGDWIYKNHVVSSIKSVKEDSDDSDLPLNLRLRKKGGVNIYLGLIMLFFAMEFALAIVSIILY